MALTEGKKVYIKYEVINGVGRFHTERIVKIQAYNRKEIPIFCDEMYMNNGKLEVKVVTTNKEKNSAIVSPMGDISSEYEVSVDSLIFGN